MQPAHTPGPLAGALRRLFSSQAAVSQLSQPIQQVARPARPILPSASPPGRPAPGEPPTARQTVNASSARPPALAFRGANQSERPSQGPARSSESPSGPALSLSTAKRQGSPKKEEPISLEQLVSECKSGELKKGATAAAVAIYLGGRFHNRIRQRLGTITRAQAVAEIRAALEAGGITGETLDVGRQIGCWWVYRVFGKAAQKIPLSVVRQFVPLLRRDRKTETWEIRLGYRDWAQQVFDRAASEHWSGTDTKRILDKARGVKPKAPPAQPSRAQRVRKLLASLTLEELALIGSDVQARIRTLASGTRSAA